VVWEQALLPEFEGKPPLIHKDAQEKEIEIRPVDAHSISDFFTQQITIHALQHPQIPKRLEDYFPPLFQSTIQFQLCRRGAEALRNLTKRAFAEAVVSRFTLIDLQ
jgi:hypothetical protein